MRSHARRRATRLRFEAPALVVTAAGPVRARIRDVSRLGVGLRLSTRHPSLDLGRTASSVRAAIPGAVDLMLCHTERPAAVECAGRVTRIGVPLDVRGAIDLGVSLDAPLSDADAAALGLVFPPLAEDGDTPARAPATTWAFHTILTSSARGARSSLPCKAARVGPESLRVRVPRASFDGVGLLAGSVADAAVEFSERFGTRLGLKLRDGEREHWSGPVRVCSVGLPEDRPQDMELELAYERRLDAAALKGLGIKPR